MEVCPTEIVHASAERVWHLVTEPQELARWTGMKLASGPAGTVRAGDRFVLGAGPMHVSFEVLETEPFRSLRLFIRFPFGIVNHEQIQITPAGVDTCRVTFN